MDKVSSAGVAYRPVGTRAWSSGRGLIPVRAPGILDGQHTTAPTVLGSLMLAPGVVDGMEEGVRLAVGRVVEWFALFRSLIVYWRPGRQRVLRRFYRPLVGPGDLVFDVGAHLGDRAAAFAALGARVVALEPQPQVVSWLRRLVGRNDRITVRAEAVGRSAGAAHLAISRRTPTVSTLAEAWRKKLPEANPSFRRVRWEESVEVPVITLDALIETYGPPQFCKIDVEGYEAEVLAGLTHPVPGVSVEFVSGSVDVAVACVRRLEELGSYEFNAVPGESRRFVFDSWVTGNCLAEWLASGAGGVSSGDLYARLLRDSRCIDGAQADLDPQCSHHA